MCFIIFLYAFILSLQNSNHFLLSCHLLDKLQTRCCVSHHQIWLHPPVWPWDGHLHLHEQDQRRDHFCHSPSRSHIWNHWREPQGTGTSALSVLTVDRTRKVAHRHCFSLNIKGCLFSTFEWSSWAHSRRSTRALFQYSWLSFYMCKQTSLCSVICCNGMPSVDELFWSSDPSVIKYAERALKCDARSLLVSCLFFKKTPWSDRKTRSKLACDTVFVMI